MASIFRVRKQLHMKVRGFNRRDKAALHFQSSFLCSITCSGHRWSFIACLKSVSKQSKQTLQPCINELSAAITSQKKFLQLENPFSVTDKVCGRAIIKAKVIGNILF